MKELRLGIIGLGGMGSVHAASILAGNIPRCRLAGVCDLEPDKVAKYPGLYGCTDSDAFIASGEVDAVLVATPHYFHTTIGVAALKAGLHLLVEKPISVHKADCESLIAAKLAAGREKDLLVVKQLRAILESGNETDPQS